MTVVTKPERPSNAVMQGTVPSTQYDIEYVWWLQHLCTVGKALVLTHVRCGLSGMTR